jgi:hypothetical protein
MNESENGVPQVVQDLAASCVRFVARALESPLDYTQDTLPLLDHYLRTATEAEDEILGLVVPAAGAYFGEVVRRHFGQGTWTTKEDDYAEWRLVVHPGPLSFNPIGVALECATDGSEGGSQMSIPDAQREPIESALEHMGEVREDDYYTFAVRFEALELVHEKLIQLLKAKKQNGSG